MTSSTKLPNSSPNKDGHTAASEELAEVLSQGLTHIFSTVPRTMKPMMPKLLPLRSFTMQKLEKMQQEIEAVMKASNIPTETKPDPSTEKSA